MPPKSHENTLIFYGAILCISLYVPLSFLAVHAPEINYFDKLTVLGAFFYFILLYASTKNIPLGNEIRLAFLSVICLHFIYTCKVYTDMDVPYDIFSVASKSATVGTFVDMFREFAVTTYQKNHP